MKKNSLLLGLFIAFMISFSWMPRVFAGDPFGDIYGGSGTSIGAPDSDACTIDPTNPACDPGGNAFDTATNVINVVLSIAGVAATVVIIIAGITVTTSAGDAGKVKKAKNAIIYAAIGLAVAIGAAAIVNFVLGNVF